MALQYTATACGCMALGSDVATNERGLIMKMINKTGANTVKGSVVTVSTGTDNSFQLQSNEYDSIGIVYEAGVADGSAAWIWLAGICQVLYKDSTASTRGNICIAADTDGRAIDIQNPGIGLPATDTHFKEIGHVTETKTAGTNVLVLVNIHFN